MLSHSSRPCRRPPGARTRGPSARLLLIFLGLLGFMLAPVPSATARTPGGGHEGAAAPRPAVHAAKSGARSRTRQAMRSEPRGEPRPDSFVRGGLAQQADKVTAEPTPALPGAADRPPVTRPIGTARPITAHPTLSRSGPAPRVRAPPVGRRTLRFLS